MNYEDAKKRLEAAHTFFSSSLLSRDQFTALRTLLEGIHKDIDSTLAECDEAFSRLEKLYNGDVIELAADHLPEDTDENKKRKKALLFFIKFWKDLQTEVARVQSELNRGNHPNQSSFLRKIFSAAKGPFGIVTIVAIGAAVALQATSVHLIIKNNNCGTLVPFGSLPIPLPGLSLPKDPIENGSSGVATLPALTVSIDGTQAGSIYMSALKLSVSFQIPSTIRDVTLDGSTLLKKKTEVHLGSQKEHTIVFSCR